MPDILNAYQGLHGIWLPKIGTGELNKVLVTGTEIAESEWHHHCSLGDPLTLVQPIT